ncbi:hypothetical protein P3S67_014875 [Capsicum chacoense]
MSEQCWIYAKSSRSGRLWHRPPLFEPKDKKEKGITQKWSLAVACRPSGDQVRRRQCNGEKEERGGAVVFVGETSEGVSVGWLLRRWLLRRRWWLTEICGLLGDGKKRRRKRSVVVWLEIW